jgi:hypothetical protein
MDSMRDTVKKDIYDAQGARKLTEAEIEQVWEYLYGDDRLDEVFSKEFSTESTEYSRWEPFAK